MIFRDVHEPIIERAVLVQVQEKIVKSTKCRPLKPENAEKKMFCDLLLRADCRKKLWFHVNVLKMTSDGEVTVKFRLAGIITLSPLDRTRFCQDLF